MTSTATATARATHPLAPLSAVELARAWEILRAQQPLGARTRVISIALQEPPRRTRLEPADGGAVERAAFVVLIDSAAARTYEAVVSLTRERVLSWTHVPGV